MRFMNNFASGVGVFAREAPSEASRVEFPLASAILATWLMPALLNVIQGESAVRTFLADSALHTRSLVAVPALILGEYFSIPLLQRIAKHFRGLIPENETKSFETYLSPVCSFRLSAHAMIVVTICAYAAVLILISSLPLTSVGGWQKSSEEGLRPFSPAGWWNALVGVPLTLCLLFAWLWRLFLWSRFLWRISKLRLQLIPSHPDGLAGLRFLGNYPAAFIPLSFALSAILAGMITNRVLLYGDSVMRYRDLLVGLVMGVILLFCAPSMILAEKLLEVRRRGTVAYSKFARRIGFRFEEKWINDSNPDGVDDEEMLKAPDFSATADFYSVADNVYRMRIMPVDLKSLGIVIIVTLLPFLPVALLQLPFDTILQKAAALLV